MLSLFAKSFELKSVDDFLGSCDSPEMNYTILCVCIFFLKDFIAYSSFFLKEEYNAVQFKNYFYFDHIY